MSFGIYIHTPYCIQRCPYCDFATYEKSKIPPIQNYIELVREEIRQKSGSIKKRNLNTLFLGGGTPSLLEPEHILTLFHELENHGFNFSKDSEVTIEINPATLDPKKIEGYLKIGINRFSVGAQTFDDTLLKKLGRMHSSADTIETLNLLKSFGLNYSLDLLFALPNQSKEQLSYDLEKIDSLSPQHVSCYYLTVPESNPLSQNRPQEDVQLDMFDLVFEGLEQSGFKQYEISNFAKPNFYSRHNMLYWTDEEYWGLGLSAHSYSKDSQWGTRYWNPKTYNEYESLIGSNRTKNFQTPTDNLPVSNFEMLEMHEALTDFCHTSLRLSQGLSIFALQKKFLTSVVLNRVYQELAILKNEALVERNQDHYFLSKRGKLISNKVYERLTFLKEDLI
jgi:oxygen-independent coproporphyrinogen-3 oxidase